MGPFASLNKETNLDLLMQQKYTNETEGLRKKFTLEFQDLVGKVKLLFTPLLLCLKYVEANSRDSSFSS
jgi:hypothetical protein